MTHTRTSTEPLVNVARFLPKMAEKVPDHPAVLAPVRTTRTGTIHYDTRTFAELDALVDACCYYLESRGLARGDRCQLMVRPGLELIVLCFSLFKMGVVPVVIDPGMGMKKFLSCVERTGPDALVGIFPAMALSRVFPKPFATVRSRVFIPGRRRFLEILQPYQSRGPYPLADTRAEDPAAVLFTSGSTGPPKGVCYEHGMFEAQVRLIRQAYAIEAGEVDLPMLPVFALFNPAMGMTMVVPEMNPSRPATVDPLRIIRAIRQNGVTNSFGSPVLWRKIGLACADRGIQLPSIRRILIAGAPVPPDLIRLFEPILPNGEIHTPYGATESLPVSTWSGHRILEETWARTQEGNGTCVGSLFPEMECRILPILDEDIESMNSLTPLKTGMIGEICVRGPVVTRDYDRLPGATAAAKIRDDRDPDRPGFWHRMGDLGYLDEQGRIWFCGRKAERVEVAPGSFLFTDPVEAIFNRHPRVFRTALVGLGERGSQEPVLVVEPEAGAYPASADERKRFISELEALRDAGSGLETIRRFFFEKAFPVDVRHNAKIHRLHLKIRYEKEAS